MKTLHAYHTAYAGYHYRYRKHSQVHGFNLEESGESILLDCFKDYDWVHFWSSASLKTMRAMFDEIDRPIITFTNPFGAPVFPQNEKPFDIQFHVSRHAMGKYFRLDKDGWQCENIVSYLPIDTEVFAPKEKERGEEFIVARTGRPDVWKWDLFTLDIVRRLIAKGIKAKLLILGGMPKFAKDYAEKYEIPILESIPYEKRDEHTDARIAERLSKADAYVHSSFIGESCGISVLEAMSCGIPAIVRNTPYADNAPAEYIRDYSNGLLAKDTWEGARYAGTIFKYRPDLARILGKEARKTVMDTFDTPKVIRRMEDAVEVVAKGEHPRIDKEQFGARLKFLIGVQERRRGLIR